MTVVVLSILGAFWFVGSVALWVWTGNRDMR